MYDTLKTIFMTENILFLFRTYTVQNLLLIVTNIFTKKLANTCHKVKNQITSPLHMSICVSSISIPLSI